MDKELPVCFFSLQLVQRSIALCQGTGGVFLVEHARNKNAAKCGGDWERISLTDLKEAASTEDPDLIELDDALHSLATFDPRQSRVVELRYFGGLTIEETAEVLGLSSATVEREWSLARAWLRRELSNRR